MRSLASRPSRISSRHGQASDDLGVRPRDVPEQRDAQVGTRLAQVPGHEREVIVLEHDERGLIAHLLEDRLGEAAVHIAIALPLLATEARPHVGDVAQRPEPAVCEAGIVEFVVFRGEPNAPQVVARRVGRTANAVVGIDDAGVGRAAAMSHPGATQGLHHGVERHGQSAGVARPAEFAVALVVRIGLSIGGDHEPEFRERVPGPGEQTVARGVGHGWRAQGDLLSHPHECCARPLTKAHATS